MLSFRRRKSARAGIRAALLAGATVAAVGLSAGSASASPSCTGNNIIGEGASLQKNAQQNVWTPAFHTEICNDVGTEPTVTYESVGSGAGLKAVELRQRRTRHNQHRAPVHRHRRRADRSADQKHHQRHHRRRLQRRQGADDPGHADLDRHRRQSACRLRRSRRSPTSTWRTCSTGPCSSGRSSPTVRAAPACESRDHAGRRASTARAPPSSSRTTC